MDTHELLQKISVLPLIAGSLAEDILAGNFRSVFRGQGMEFDEVRHYQPGDDVRSIDWNASARFGDPFVKMYREERELTVMILLDTSASMRCRSWGGAGLPGSGQLSPYEQGLLAAALIAFSAEQTGQRLGAFLFDREIDRVFPPRKGRRHIMTFISGALQYLADGGRDNSGRPPAFPAASAAQGSNLRAALSGAGRMLKRRSLVVMISDFFSVNWEAELGDLSRKHDVIALRISDPLDRELPALGLVTMEDPETGLRLEAPAGFPSFRKAWSMWHEDRTELWMNLCRRAGAAYLDVSTNADAAAVLRKFFGSGRKNSRSRGQGYAQFYGGVPADNVSPGGARV